MGRTWKLLLTAALVASVEGRCLPESSSDLLVENVVVGTDSVPVSLVAAPSSVVSSLLTHVADILLREAAFVNATVIRSDEPGSLMLRGCSQLAYDTEDAMDFFRTVYGASAFDTSTFLSRCPATIAQWGVPPYAVQRRRLSSRRPVVRAHRVDREARRLATAGPSTRVEDLFVDAPVGMAALTSRWDVDAWLKNSALSSSLSAEPVSSLGGTGYTLKNPGMYGHRTSLAAVGLQSLAWTDLRAESALRHFVGLESLPNLIASASAFASASPHTFQGAPTGIDASRCGGHAGSVRNGTCALLLMRSADPIVYEITKSILNHLDLNVSIVLLEPAAWARHVRDLTSSGAVVLVYSAENDWALESVGGSTAWQGVPSPGLCSQASGTSGSVPTALRVWSGAPTQSDTPCRIPSTTFRKVAWPGLRTVSRRAQELLSRFGLSSSIEESMRLAVATHAPDGTMTQIKTAACEWAKGNTESWNSWIPAPRTCGANDMSLIPETSCDGSALPRLPVRVSWLVPLPTDTSKPGTCRGGSVLPDSLSVACPYADPSSPLLGLVIGLHSLVEIAIAVFTVAILVKLLKSPRTNDLSFFGRHDIRDASWMVLVIVVFQGVSIGLYASPPSRENCFWLATTMVCSWQFAIQLCIGLLWRAISRSRIAKETREGEGSSILVRAKTPSSPPAFGRGAAVVRPIPAGRDTPNGPSAYSGSHPVVILASDNGNPCGSWFGPLCLLGPVWVSLFATYMVMFATSDRGVMTSTDVSTAYGTVQVNACPVVAVSATGTRIVMALVTLLSLVALVYAVRETAKSLQHLEDANERCAARWLVFRVFPATVLMVVGILACLLGLITGLSGSVAGNIAACILPTIPVSCLLWRITRQVIFQVPPVIPESDIRAAGLHGDIDRVERFVRKIGSSAFADTYQAKYDRHDVVLKQFAAAPDRPAIQMLRRYALRMSSLRHPNVCALLALVESPMAIITQYHPNGTIGQALEALRSDIGEGNGSSSLTQRQRRTSKRLLDAAVDVVDGVRFLHAHGIVHGSVVPNNVVLSTTWAGIVTDPGLSSLRDALTPKTEKYKSFTTGNYSVGNPMSAPEVLRSEPESTASDVFSWAMILFSAAYGEFPFEGADGMRVPLLIAEGAHPLSFDSAKQRVPLVLSELQKARLNAILIQCWNTDPAKRPNMTDVRQQLAHAMLIRGTEEDDGAMSTADSVEQGLKVDKESLDRGKLLEHRAHSSRSEHSSSSGANRGKVQQKARHLPPVRVNGPSTQATGHDASSNPSTTTASTGRVELFASQPGGSGPLQGVRRGEAKAAAGTIPSAPPSQTSESASGHDGPADGGALAVALEEQQRQHAAEMAALKQEITKLQEKVGKKAHEEHREEPAKGVSRGRGEETKRSDPSEPSSGAGAGRDDEARSRDSRSADSRSHGHHRRSRRRDKARDVQQRSSKQAASEQPQGTSAGPAGALDEGLDHLNGALLDTGPVIGRGQFGVICKGTFDGKPVAVKQLQMSRTKKSSRDAFVKECKIMMSVKHPNVVDVMGTVRKDDTLLLIMELCARGDLFTLIQHSRRRKRVKDHFRFVLHLLTNVSDGMACLHERRLIHRDLKSMNVLLSSSYTAKVSDFGLSRFLTEGSAKTMTRCGSPIWAAPEVLRGERYNEQVDVYSFAVIAFECSEWRPPYPSHLTGMQIMQAVAFRHTRPEKSVTWPKALLGLVQRSWEDDYRARPTFKEISAKLREMWSDQATVFGDVE